MSTPTTIELAQRLSDPAPPVPTAEIRALVHARATSIAHRQRVVRGALGAVTAVACVALLAVGVAAVTDTASGPRGVEAATAAALAHVSVDPGDVVTPEVELDATLIGEAGTFHAHVRTPGTLSFDDVPTGDYELRWSWSSDDGTAAAAGRRSVHVDAEDLTITL